jgi:pimeloyl-ACP methyl ester carboxylesterase
MILYTLFGLAAATAFGMVFLISRKKAELFCLAKIDALHFELSKISLLECNQSLRPVLFSLKAQVSYLSWNMPRRRASRRNLLYGFTRKKLRQLEADISSFRSGVNPFKGRTGVMLRGFQSSVDGGLTSYSLLVPVGAVPAAGWPLILNLHGRGDLAPFRGHPAPSYGDGIMVLSPHGKGSIDYMEAAEVDVLTALEEVCAFYLIDPDRIYVCGASMGGTGAWHLAAHYPDRFAALAAVSANSDDAVWQELWEESATAPEPDSVHAALKKIERSDSPICYVSNLKHVPALVIHGGADKIVPVQHARNITRALRKAGSKFEYRELAGVGHDVEFDQMRHQVAQWLLKHSRVKAPASLHYVTDGRWSGAYWISGIVPGAPLDICQVRAEIEGLTGLSVNTVCCRSLTLNLGDTCLAGSSSIMLKVDGQNLGNVKPVTIALESSAGQWSVVRNQAERKATFSPHGVSSLLRNSFIIVVGTSGPEALKISLKRAAKRFVSSWRNRYFATPRLFEDHQVTSTMLKNNNLILYGGASENSVTAGLLESSASRGVVPVIEISDGKCKVSGREFSPFSSDSLGAIFVTGNPYNLQRRAAIIWGSSWRALEGIDSRFGNSFDWTVFENRKWFDYAVFDEKTSGPETFLEVGLLDTSGKIQYSWGRESEVDLPGSLPRFQDVSEIDQDSLLLEELVPASVQQSRCSVGFGRSSLGGWITLGASLLKHKTGLGVKAPSRISYLLKGGFKRFKATVGADLRGRSIKELKPIRVANGQMKFSVFCDGREVYCSPALGPLDQPLDIDVNVQGVQEMELRVLPASKYEWHLGCGAWGRATLERAR